MARAYPQLLALAAGLALWSVAPSPAFWALILAYVLGVWLIGVLDLQRLFAALPRAASVVLLAIVLVPGAAALLRARTQLIAAEGLYGLPTLVADRLRLEETPSIAPPLVAADRPQTFFVRAAPGAAVRARFGERAAMLAADELGHGLFRIDYDPRRDGPPVPHNGRLLAAILVDGEAHRRELLAATPLAHPRWLCTGPDRRLAGATSQETDELAIVSVRGLERRIAVGDGPTDCAFVASDQVAVAHRDDDALWLVDAASGARRASARIGAGQVRLALSPDRSLLAVARATRTPEVVLLALPGLQVAARIALQAAPDWLAFGRNAETLVVATRRSPALRRFRRQEGGFRADGVLALTRPAVTLARSNDGATLFVAVTDFEPGAGSHLGNHFVQDQILSVDVASLRVVGVRLSARRSPRQSKPGDVDRGVSPLGIAQASDGALLVTFAGSDELWRLREPAADPQIIDLAVSGLYAPHGVAELEHGALVVSSPVAGALGLLRAGERALRVLRLAPDDAYLSAHDRVALARRLGERGFYEATRAGISCQSCHLHADSDESAHNLGDGRLLPTLSVAGLARSGPYLRDGSYAQLSDLDHVARMLYRGYLRHAPGRAQTLAAYLEGLPRRSLPRAAAPRDRARERRGTRVMASAGCPGCHAFPAFTNLGQQLLRSLVPQHALRLPSDEVVDTPSLLSLATSAPYLHDGRARTLQDVLTVHNRDNRHGDTRGLSAAQRADLIALLESL